MDRQDRIDRLQLDDHPIGDEQVGPIAVVDRQTFITYRDQSLPAHRQILFFQFVEQTSFISALEQPRTDGRVDLHRRTQ